MADWLYHGTGIGAAVHVFSKGVLRGFTPVPGGKGVSLSATVSVSLERCGRYRSIRSLPGVLEHATRASQTWQRYGAVLTFPADELGRLIRLTRQDVFAPGTSDFEDEVVSHGNISGDALALAEIHAEPGALEAYAEAVRQWASVPTLASGFSLPGERDRKIAFRHAEAADALALRVRPLTELSDAACHQNGMCGR